MLPNKWIMLLEMIAVMFLVATSDVSQPKRLRYEENGHIFRGWRVLLSDFSVEQPIGVVGKMKI